MPPREVEILQKQIRPLKVTVAIAPYEQSLRRKNLKLQPYEGPTKSPTHSQSGGLDIRVV